jgi:tetratricopeptide (TPR) repeat protein
MRPISRKLRLCIFLLLLSETGTGAEMIKAHEPRYAEAVLAYNTKKYEETLRILDSLLAEAPNLVEFLELKALALKSAKNDKESLKTYGDLIRVKIAEGVPQKNLAPYYFEVGVLYFRAKRIEESRSAFQFSIKNGFNVETANFFLGLMAYQSGDFTLAFTSFENAAKSSQRELKAAAMFYLAQTSIKLGDSPAALSSFAEAKSLTEGLEDDTSLAIRKAASKVLEPLDQSKKFASISLSTSYDSNVQALPNALDGTLAFNKGSIKNILQAGYGYMSSPTRTFQLVPQYRLLYNYNYNRDTREGEFLSQYVSLYLNRKPLEKSGYGFKIDASLTFQNRVNLETDSSTYRIFSSTGTLGAYYRTRFGKHLNSNLEVSAGPQHYNTDSSLSAALSDQRRSGGIFSLREILSGTGFGRLLNPALILSFTEIDAEGNGDRSEFASLGGSAILSNGFQWTDRLRNNIGISYSQTFYNRRSSFVRVDRNYSIQADLSYQLNPKWNVIADASLSYNDSNVPSAFEYRRWTVSTGLSYSFY